MKKKTMFQLLVRLDLIVKTVCTKEEQIQVTKADQLELPLDMEPEKAAKEFKDYFAGRRELPVWMYSDKNQRN